ncbi:MAG: ATP-binding cassette domain-containing protein [Planctomycetota bacterium]
MIELARVTKRFGSAAAVRGVDAVFDRGTVTALIGPSGCGKSTLLRMMLGLILPDEGTVSVEGRPVDRWDATSLRARCGYAIQSGGLFPHLTARQNAELPAKAHGRALDPSRIEELCELTRFEPSLLSRLPGELSGGQRQRVALMRALVLDPEVLLLDEPLGALDPLVRAELQRDLRGLFEALGKTVVMVTHDLAEAAYLAPQSIALLRDGKLEQRGSFASLQGSPASGFVREFLDAQTERARVLVAGGSA